MNPIRVIQVPPGLLRLNPWNPNYVDPDNEKKLRASIEKFGVYKPVICRRLADGGLEILGGQHRAQVASAIGMTEVPVVDLGPLDDKTAKAIGLVDNGRYGEDDALRLADVLRDIGGDAELFLPFSEDDLAGIFAATSVDLDKLSMPDDDDEGDGLAGLVEKTPTLTHQLMKFKVPIEDAGRVQELVDLFIKSKGYSKDTDSLAAAGMALVDVCNAARAGL